MVVKTGTVPQPHPPHCLTQHSMCEADSATRLLINRCHGKHAKMQRFSKFKMHVFFKNTIF